MMRTLVIAIALVIGTHAVSSAAQARRFESWDDAVDALVAAVRAGDQKALMAILGPQARTLVSSGDQVADRQRFQQFVSAYDQKHWLEGGGGEVRLYVGDDDFPFPIPLVPDGPWWRWNTAAARDEILRRRVGRNELNALQACLAYVDAQREYFAEDRDGNNLLEYAQRFRSRPGTRDGLYWETQPGAPLSPLGPLVAQARSEGYRARATGATPYHGYLFRILTAQGPDAPDGAYDYVVNGHMIGGFALVAFPARYGDSGVMTFIVSHDGVIYQKNLGADTARVAGAMTSFNPDRSWDRITFTTAQR